MNRPYHAYLLRLWREESAEYRLTLENAHTRQLTPLPDLQAIVDFLQQQIDNDQSRGSTFAKGGTSQTKES